MPIEPAIDGLATDRETLRIPRHLGVIMDGNGRWARSRGKPRTEGHRAGVQALRRLVDLCIRYDVPCLTVFSFSSENWSRPRDEISFIFSLLRRFVATDLETLMRNNVKVRIIGERDGLDRSLVGLIDKVEADTRENTGLLLIVAFNYGSKAEITRAVRRIARDVADGKLRPEDITEDVVANELLTRGIPDPDLIIRTSGELRLSNFLLWQAAYAELVFVDEHWPDFDESIFLRVLREFSGRERRFGGVGAGKG